VKIVFILMLVLFVHGEPKKGLTDAFETIVNCEAVRDQVLKDAKTSDMDVHAECIKVEHKAEQKVAKPKPKAESNS
jgi:hypothetical protein